MFTHFKHLLSKDSFLKHVFLLAGSTALSQGVLILTAPFLTRLYTPDDFGLFAVLFSLLSILQVMVSLRYEMAIPLAKNNQESAHLLGLSFALVWIMSGMIGIMVWSFAGNFKQMIHVLLISEDWGWFMFSVLGVGHYQALKYFTTRHQQFHLLSITQIWQSLIQAFLQIGLGVMQKGSIGLIVGFVISQWVGILILLRHAQPFLTTSLNLQDWINVVRIYRHFPLYTLWASLLNVLGWQLPPLLFAAYFSIEVAGLYALVMRVLGMPSALIGQAVAQVFYPLAAQTIDTRSLLERVASLLFVLSFVSFSLVFIHGAFLFQIIFGQEWHQAGRYAQWLSPWFMFALISSPISTFALVKSKQRQAFWFTLYETCLRLGAISLGIHLDSPAMAIQLFSIAGVLICLVHTQWILYLTGSNLWNLIKRLQQVGIVGIGLLMSLLLLEKFLSPTWALSVSLISLLVFGGWAWKKVDKM